MTETQTEATVTIPDRTSIINLNRELIDIDQKIMAESHRIDELRARSEKLGDRLNELRGSEPALDDIVDQSLIDDLVGNPSAVPDAAVLGTAVKEARTQHDGWRVQFSVVERAIAQIDNEIGNIRTEREGLSAQREQLWCDFVELSHTYLINRFREEFGTLCSEILFPLVAMEKQVTGPSKRGIVYGGPCLFKQSVIEIHHPNEGYSSKTERLFSWYLDADVFGSALNDFRSGLSSATQSLPKK